MLAGVCPACGAQGSLDSRYCDACGTPLRRAASAPSPSRFGSPSGYTPRHLADRILRSRTAMEGERKQVTVLFADIKSSMELLADRDPEQARALLDPILELMIEAVHAYEGMVNQVMGDGIMALFGAPLAMEDHAVRGCYAALRMLASVARHGDDVHRRHGIPVHIRIGLNSGDVLVRSIGSDLAMDYTAVGQTTHLAARLEQMANPSTALCATPTLRLVEGVVHTRPLGAVPIRGLPEPVEVAELTGVVPSRIRFHATAARGLSPFVGRQQERETVAQALARAQAGHGQVIALVGEPGVGKSRLTWEITRSPLVDGWLVLEASAMSYGVATPYLTIRALLAAYFEIEDGDDPMMARTRVIQRLLAAGADLADTAPPVLALLDLPVEDPRWTTLDPPQRRQKTSEAVRAILLGQAERRPVLLVVEDLHWADRETEALLDDVVQRSSAARLAVLLNARPEYRHAWGSRPSYTQLRIQPLTRAEAELLLGSLIGADPGLRPLASTLIELTGGNPFFLEESVRALVERGILAGEPGHYRPARPFESFPVPASVHAMVAARIDRLGGDEKELLQAAAAIGPTVAVRLLAAVTGRDPDRLRATLETLREAEFLHESQLYPELEYRFPHALVADVAYAGLLQDRRRALHGRILEAMETVDPRRRAEQVERLAHHAIAGEQWDRAVTYAREAATKAASRSAYREAVAHLEAALAALGRLPPTEATLALAVDLRLELRSALFPLREIVRDLENLRAAETLAAQLGDHRRLAWVLTYLTRDLSILGKPDLAIECGQRALALVPGVSDVELEILLDAYLGAVCFARGEYGQAVAILERGVARVDGDRALERFGLPGPAAVFFRIWLVSSLVRLGEFPRAAEHVEASLAIAERADQPLARLVAHYTEGFLHAHQGDLGRAIQALETSLSICHSWRLPAWFSNVASILGWVYVASGRTKEGADLMQRAIDESAAGGGMVNHSSEVVRLAEGKRRDGQVADAQALGRRALELARTHKEQGNEAIALQFLGELASRLEPPDVEAAEATLTEAIALASALGMGPTLDACHAARARLRAAAGQPAEARAQPAAASSADRPASAESTVRLDSTGDARS